MEIIRQHFRLIVASLFMSFVATVHAVQAGNIYQEPAGRFTIELPKGYAVAPGGNKLEYHFKGPGPDIVLVYLPNSVNAGQAYRQMRGLLSQNMKGVSQRGPIRKLELKGRQITLGNYKGFISLERKITRPIPSFRDDLLPKTHREPPFELIKIDRFAIIGTVLLNKGVVGYLSIYTSDQKTGWQQLLINSLYTIRD